MSETQAAADPELRRNPLISRDRLIELALVVVGVFIALGLENLVQELRYRDDAVQLEEALADDFYATIYIAKERQAVAPCLRQRLQEIQKRVSAGSTKLNIDEDPSSSKLGFVTRQTYRAPTRVWITSSFDRALASEAFKRVPEDRASRYASMFALIANIGDLNDAEYLAIAGLAPLAYEQPNWSSAERYEALHQLAIVDRYQTLLNVNTRQVITNIFAIPGVKDAIIERFARAEQSEPGGLDAFREKTKRDYGDCVDLSVYDEILVKSPIE